MTENGYAAADVDARPKRRRRTAATATSDRARAATTATPSPATAASPTARCPRPASSVYPGTERFVGGCGAPTYADIQAAIDAASDGDVITICSGTYTQPVVVTKQVKIHA